MTLLIRPLMTAHFFQLIRGHTWKVDEDELLAHRPREG